MIFNPTGCSIKTSYTNTSIRANTHFGADVQLVEHEYSPQRENATEEQHFPFNLVLFLLSS